MHSKKKTTAVMAKIASEVMAEYEALATWAPQLPVSGCWPMRHPLTRASDHDPWLFLYR
jgi:hypothetical protein